MVRGFGNTVGRSAANSVLSTNKTSQKVQQNLSKRQLELIKEFEGHIKEFQELSDRTEISYESGKITKAEYQILKRRTSEGIENANLEIEKLKSVNTNGVSWSVIIGTIIGLIVLFNLFT